jgi:hypothetical protein
VRSTSLEDLGRLFPDLVGGRPESIGDPALEKARLFDAVDRLLSRTTDCRPMLLLLDDIQWADVATLEMVQHLARPAARRLERGHPVGQRRRTGEGGRQQPARANPEPDHAIALLAEGLDLALTSGLGEAVRRVNEARHHLQPWADLLELRRLDEQLQLV